MIIKNFSRLSKRSKSRERVLNIIEEGLKSISPSFVFRSKITLRDNELIVGNKIFDLSKFKNIYICGFGKASVGMAVEIEKLLGKRIKNGLVIDVVEKPLHQKSWRGGRKLKRIKVKKGTHPYLSKKNIKATEQIINMLDQASGDDLVICLISGGGSALFEKPYHSFDKTLKMNRRLLTSGASIHEINIIRKHTSQVKGGNLAKLTKAKIISLIFSDVVGDNLDIIASGPTVMDRSSISDAKKIIKKYNLSKIKLYETPKDRNIFKKVDNIILLNNLVALKAMKGIAEKIGYEAKIKTNALSEEARKIGEKLSKLARKMKKNEIYLFGGETTVTVKGKGKGGRNTELALSFLKNLPPQVLFLSIDSDGNDNTDAAGSITDKKTWQASKKLRLNVDDYLRDNDSYTFFQKTGDLIFTGPTGSNVADLILVMKY